VLLGKGPSVDEIDRSCFTDSVVIGINDAERIAPADITIFHEDRFGDSIVANGARSRLYLTSADFRPPRGEVVRLPHARLVNDSADLMLSRLVDSTDLVIEDVIFLTALEVARMIATSKGRTQTVYMVGFDLDPTLGYSKAAAGSFGAGPLESRHYMITMQEHFLRNALYMLRDSNVKLVHVGIRDFSELTPAGFNALFRKAVPTREFAPEVRASQDVLVVAELTTNHLGDRLRLERLIRESRLAGADYVKLQKRDVDSFYTPTQLAAPYVSPLGTTFGDYRRALELDEDDFRFVDQLCADIGIGWFASVLDRASYEFFRSTGLMPTMIKLPSTISEHTEYLEFVAKDFEGPLVLSTGMTDQGFEDWVLEQFGSRERLFLMHANSAYPTPDEHCNVGVVRHYSELAAEYPCIVPGYSSHDFGWMASALAVAAGAGMVEKHVKLGITEWAHFDVVAVDLATPAFVEYVQRVRQAQLMVGEPSKHVTPSEHHKYRWRP
jgi:N-acetylneuraminate synthase